MAVIEGVDCVYCSEVNTNDPLVTLNCNHTAHVECLARHIHEHAAMPTCASAECDQTPIDTVSGPFGMRRIEDLTPAVRAAIQNEPVAAGVPARTLSLRTKVLGSVLWIAALVELIVLTVLVPGGGIFLGTFLAISLAAASGYCVVSRREAERRALLQAE